MINISFKWKMCVSQEIRTSEMQENICICEKPGNKPKCNIIETLIFHASQRRGNISEVLDMCHEDEDRDCVLWSCDALYLVSMWRRYFPPKRY